MTQIKTAACTVATIGETGFDPANAIQVTRIRTSDMQRGRLVQDGDRNMVSVRVFLKDAPASTLITPAGVTRVPAARAFQTMLRDLRPSQGWRSDHDLDVLSFDIPIAALERRARVLGISARLDFQSNVPMDDEVFEGFARSVLPFLNNPAGAPRIFVDHVLHSACAYVLRSFGAERPVRTFGGLAAWQERRAKDMILASLDTQVALKDLAEACRLSVSHFTKAFRQSTGQTPYQWLIGQRIERAKHFMLQSRAPLAGVASDCGFADQSHFTNTFTKRVGASPAAWRRQSMAAHP